jgi:hypothetical protein
MKAPEVFEGPVTIKSGYGYWDVTVHPMGGDFRRARTAINLAGAMVQEWFETGEPRLFTGMYGDRKVAVQSECCDY